MVTIFEHNNFSEINQLYLSIKAYMIKNESSCYCPDNCNSVWYTHTISSGNGPNSVAEFPSSLLKQEKFHNLSKRDFIVYAKLVYCTEVCHNKNQ